MRALRGHRSQVQLARRLGYRGNPVTDWERGERFPTIHEALRVASLTGVDVPAAFARFAAHIPLQLHDGEPAIGPWLSALRGDASLAELAERVQGSRFSISRWFKGEARPRLPDFFRLLDAITGRLPEWTAQLVEIAQVTSLAERYQGTMSAKRLAYEVPWTEAVLRLLETTGYRSLKKQRTAYIACALGIDEAQVRACLQRLSEAQVIEKVGGRYRVRGQSVVDTHGGKDALNSLKRHWSSVAAQRLLAPHDEDFFAYNVISLSAADLAVAREKLRATFRELRSLVAASQPEEVAALINLQVVTFLPSARNDRRSF